MPGSIVLARCLTQYSEQVIDTVEKLYDILGIEIRVDILYEKNDLNIMKIEYPGYPVEILEMDDNILLIDGKFYSMEVDEYITYLKNDRGNIYRITPTIDGDFIVGLISPSKAVLINDPAANLYLYYYIGRDGYALSRIPFILDAVFGEKINLKYGLQIAVYEHTFSHNSPTLEVFKMRPGTILTIENGKYFEEEYYKETYDPVRECDYSWVAKEFYDLSLRRIRRLYQEGIRRIIVLLSGGLDSRIVLAGLVKASRDHYQDFEIIAKTKGYPWMDPLEVEAAEETTSILDVKHIVERNPPSRSRHGVLQRYSLVNPPQKEVIATGGGGDKIIKSSGHIKEEIPIRREDAIEWVIGLPYFTVEEVENYLGVKDYKKLIREDLSWYPEKTGSGIFSRYFVEGRIANWLVGDGVTPWSLRPFMSNPFLPLTIRMKTGCKEYFRMCRKILEYLHPSLPSVKYSNIGISLSGPFILLPLKVRIGYYITAFKKIYRGQRGPTIPNKKLAENIHREYDMINDIVYEGLRLISKNPDKTMRYLEEYIIGGEKNAKDYIKARRGLKAFTRLGILGMLRG